MSTQNSMLQCKPKQTKHRALTGPGIKASTLAEGVNRVENPKLCEVPSSLASQNSSLFATGPSVCVTLCFCVPLSPYTCKNLHHGPESLVHVYAYVYGYLTRANVITGCP